ncbi:hypothetical protein [Actinoplanes derwentensis]|uniref:Uncharacterized protein n=1 Tax=Actinoplanes derwentensis TaxID=113562 RepID=A0A1H2C737_9ACTN|nr:hypothetical protein [Actinoplanes derwentensis]GID84259.1 hypothetical protein Ade03nite_31830 [Actinoplanes derwentensis]SDT66184.1 hypothetical protein SAMN04489716_5323 [Actinoplanes derwentensis]
MIYASTKLHESTGDSGAKVFVDSSGKRRRLVAISGICAAVGAVIYISVVVAGLVQSPEIELTTRGTVATSSSGGPS